MTMSIFCPVAISTSCRLPSVAPTRRYNVSIENKAGRLQCFFKPIENCEEDVKCYSGGIPSSHFVPGIYLPLRYHTNCCMPSSPQGIFKQFRNRATFVHLMPSCTASLPVPSQGTNSRLEGCFIAVRIEHVPLLLSSSISTGGKGVRTRTHVEHEDGLRMVLEPALRKRHSQERHSQERHSPSQG